MRKIICIIFVSFLPIILVAQDSLKISNDSILYEIKETVQSIKFQNEHFGQYKIYQTDNIYILLKLDTSTGIIKMIQWSLDKTKEFETFLNSDDLSGGLLRKKGRFELYPTKNMYQFILIDTVLGSTWHVQWGTKLSELWIRPISYF